MSLVSIKIYNFCAIIFFLFISISSVECSTTRIFNKDVLLQNDNKIKNIDLNSTYIAETDLKINLKGSVDSTKQPYNKNLRKSLNRNDTTKVKIMPYEFQHKEHQKTNLSYQVDDKLLKKTNSSKELTICKIDLNESENLDDVIIKNDEDMDEDKTYLHCKVFLHNNNGNKITENLDESIIDEIHPFRELGEEEIDLITTHDYDYIDESEDIIKNEEAYRNKDSSENINKIVNPIDNDVLKNTKKKNDTYKPQLDNLKTDILFQEKTIEMENNNEPVKIGMDSIEQNNPVFLKDPYTMDSSEYAAANSQPIFIELQMKTKNDNEIYINKNSNEFTESKSIESTLFGYDDEYYTKHGLDRYSRRAKWQHIDTSTIPETRVLNYDPIVEHTHADIENKIQKKIEQHGRYEIPVQNYVTIPINYLSKYYNNLPPYIGIKPEIIQQSYYNPSYRHNYDIRDVSSHPGHFFDQISEKREKHPKDDILNKCRYHLSEICKLCNLREKYYKSVDDYKYDTSDEDAMSDESFEESFS